MFKCYCNKRIVKDDFKGGEEVGVYKSVFENEYCGLAKTIEEILDFVWKHTPSFDGFETDTWRGNLVLANGELVYSQLETKDGKLPKHYEYKGWEEGKVELFKAYYFFSFIEQRTVSTDELRELIIKKN